MGPKTVDVSYKINCISHIDAVTSTCYIDFKLFLHWTDLKFVGRSKTELIDLKAEGAFNPDIIVSNEHELLNSEEHREVKVTNPITGEIKSTARYRGTLFINVRKFIQQSTRLFAPNAFFLLWSEHGLVDFPGRLSESPNLP